MQHPDEGTIHAWLDGELPSDRANEIAAHLSDCPECSATVAEARGLIAASTRILTALDNIPAEVVPDQSAQGPVIPGRRRWYDRTDLRAAAALAIVAGASFLAVNHDSGASRETRMVADKIQPARAPAADKPAIEPPVAAPPVAEPMSALSPAVASSIGRAIKVTSKRGETIDSANFSGRGLVAGVAAGVARAPELALGAVEKRATGPTTLSEVVTTGVATTANVASPSLHVISVDSTKSTRRTVYETAQGVRVTLAESPDEALDATMQSSAEASAKVTPSMRAAPGPAPVINTISWTDRGRRYTLSGPLTTDELEALKAPLMRR